MKDVRISKLDPESIREAATFIDLMNTGEAAFVPSLDADRDSIAALLRTLVALKSVPPPRVLRLYEGQGRICGFLGVAPREQAIHGGAGLEPQTPQLVLQGPLLSIGDWAGHADALFRSLVAEIGEDTKYLELDYRRANRNMRRFAERHGFSIVSEDAGPFYTARTTIAP